MGFFDSTYVTNVNTSVSRVIDDKLLPDAVRTGTLKAIFNGGSVSDNVMEEAFNSMGIRAERMYEYADKHYTHGMPSGEIYSATQGIAQVQAVLNTLTGVNVLLEYSRTGPANAMHFARIYLNSVFRHSEKTNELVALSALKGVPVYMTDLILIIPASLEGSLSPWFLDHWGTSASSGFTPLKPAQTGVINKYVPHSRVHINPAATGITAQLSYVWEVDGSYTLPDINLVINGKVTIEETQTFAVSGYEEGATYFQAKYIVQGESYFWSYKAGLGTYPSLDVVSGNPLVETGQFFPNTYFRFEKKPLNVDKNSEAFKTSQAMLKKIGMNFDEITDSIHENPGIADVEQAMMVMAVPALSENPVECKYLFDFFSSLYLTAPAKYKTSIDVELQRIFGDYVEEDTSKIGIVIKDMLFQMGLSCSGIIKKRVGGSIGKVGSHSTFYSEKEIPVVYVDYATGTETGSIVKEASHHFRKQITDVIYEEIELIGLRMVYYIWKDYYSIGDEQDKILLIPIDRTISSKYSSLERETLYSRSLHFVFNSRVVTEVKWYQTQVFQSVMLIIAVVSTIYSLGADGGSFIAAVLSGSGAAIAAASIPILLQLLVNAAIGYVLTLFVNAVGIEVALVAAIIAAVYGVSKAIAAGSIKGAPYAASLLELSSGLSKTIQTKVTQLFTDLINQAGEFDLLKVEYEKILKTAEELLDTSTALSPLIIMGETPTQYYARTTTYAGNIGVLSLSAISMYCDTALKLPEILETLGESRYAIV